MVSTMGLMNVGKGGGAQIIQLFGRGVRLKGFEWSLKRSAGTQLPKGVERPKYIAAQETLGIFGIHADYMAQLRDFLEEEGLPTNEDRAEFLLPVIRNLGAPTLKTIRLKKVINGVSTEFGNTFRKREWELPHLEYQDLSQENRAAPGRSQRPVGVLHRLQHALAHDAAALEHAQDRDARPAHSVSGGKSGYVYPNHVGMRSMTAVICYLEAGWDWL